MSRALFGGSLAQRAGFADIGELIAAAAPGAVALDDGSSVVSYAMMNERANRAANLLIRRAKRDGTP